MANVTFPNINDLTNFQVEVAPDSGFWAGARFTFNFAIPALYPHEPPKVTCLTKIYHPNIDLAGAVCLNILREDWKPVLDINAVIYGIIYLFYEPNPGIYFTQFLFADTHDGDCLMSSLPMLMWLI